jgi:hypothetical protein
MRQTVVWLLIFSATTLAQQCVPLTRKVRRSFSVHVTNDVGPVAGLKLRVSFYKSDDFKAAQKRVADPKTFQGIVAQASTDETGTARFKLDRAGTFMLSPENRESWLDFVVLDVTDHQPLSSVVELRWPPLPILRTAHLRGRLSRGLFSSPNTPLKHRGLKLRGLVDYREVADTTTGDDGAFEFRGTGPGFYFLQLVPTPKDTVGTDLYDPGGNIAVIVARDVSRDILNISMEQTPCGLSYDLDENRERYEPKECFEGSKQVECDR